MKTLVLLYFLYLELGGVGQGKVSILKLSRYMRMSKSSMKKMLIQVERLRYIDVTERYGRNNYKQYEVSLSQFGELYLDDNFASAIEAYRQHVAETIAIINERNSGKYPEQKPLTKKQKAAKAAGQKELL